MSKTVIAIDPVTRLEGHLKVEVQVEDGKVADAWITGGMFRGFEAILRGRNPRDASQIVQRICGVCPVAHATASSLAIEAVCGVEVPENGRIARNLMLAGNYLQSNILHFYHLGGQDYFHGPDTVPFIPRYRNPDLRLSEEQNTLAMDEYIEALEVRQVCHQLAAVRDRDGRWVGFMGTEEGRLEMLFLAPQARGRGVGRRLLQYGIDRFKVRTLTVNEQNPGAVGFYQHMGFRVVRRTTLDEQGAPYPLLYMERRGPDAAPRFEQDNLYAEE